jgi:adenosylcobinamide-phosphate synthase
MITTLLIVVIALSLDSLFGEPKRFHPLVMFGRFANAIEQHLYKKNRWHGMLVVLVAIAPIVSLSALTRLTPYGLILDAVLLYLALGWHSLIAHARPVRDALRNNEIARARQQVGMIVSRDTAAMQPGDVSKATVESVLENGNDAIFGALFWFLIAGAPGAVAYRLANTLDAMWGYRNERYHAFGWAAARLDDALNFIPARLTALSYAVAGHTGSALRCWIEQAKRWDSPNAGPVMASGAGSLGLALGGPASYHGTMEDRPILGSGRAPQAADIDRALTLVDRSLAMWLIALSGGALLAYAV